MARPRSAGRRDLPPNVKVHLRRGQTYYAYRNPETGCEFGLGTDKASAIRQAQDANAYLAANRATSGDLIDRIEGTDCSVSEYAKHFAEDILPARTGRHGTLSPRTRDEYQRQLIRFEKAFNSRSMRNIARRDIATFLNSLPATAANRTRSLLGLFFKYAIAEGLRDDNPALETMPRQIRIKRQRLTVAQYRDIKHTAPAWLAGGMELGIQTLQRREDLVKLRFSDLHDGCVWVTQGKTGQNIRIKAGPELIAVIEGCRDNVACPFILHRMPERKRRSDMNRKEHWAQITPDMLTKTFQRIRDEIGVCSDLPPRERPSFHEIRSLGAELYRQTGVPEEEIRRLLGHADARMTRQYLSRHETVWLDATAGLVWDHADTGER